MGRTILGVIVGMLVAMATMQLFEYGSARVHPLPPGADAYDAATMAAHIASAPLTALLLVAGGWIVAAFDGGLVAALISRRHRRGAALSVGLLIVCGVLAVSWMFPHPLWMTVAGLLLPVPAGLLGAWLVRRPVPGTEEGVTRRG
ncbi:hypothetical protein [Lysobacter sp. CA199]|uniref:hypothetical protein n=1 Tax=Lysobacter sp. CA199 TaxID=3455608 RepID=UPI003F8D335E